MDELNLCPSSAGKPDPVRDCGVTNKTFTSIHVECKPGYDGGLQQSFVIEVFPVGAVDLGPEIGGADGGASLVEGGVPIAHLPCTNSGRPKIAQVHNTFIVTLWRY